MRRAAMSKVTFHISMSLDGFITEVVTHEEREPLPMQGGTTYTFVTDGIEAALELAVPPPATRTSASGAERAS
jgi:hypothetical protein